MLNEKIASGVNKFEQNLLDKGLQHIPGFAQKGLKQALLERLLLEIEIGIENLNVESKSTLKTYCAHVLRVSY